MWLYNMYFSFECIIVHLWSILCSRFRENEGPDDASFFFTEVTIVNNIYKSIKQDNCVIFLSTSLSVDSA